MNFRVIIIVLILCVGLIFSQVAKKYKRNQIQYFFLGMISFLLIPMLYVIIYGFMVDFKLEEGFKMNRGLAFTIGLFVSFVFYKMLIFYFKKKDRETLIDEVDKIGGE